MAASDPTLQDPLLALRRAIAASSLPTPTTTPDLSAEAQQQQTTDDLATATHLYFQHPTPQTLPLTSATRFVSASSDSTVDLRSIFFAWQKKDVAIPEYIASAQELNEALKQKREGTEQVQNLVFVERLDLITWLEGASDDSEYIKPLEGAAAVAVAEAQAEAQAAAQAAAQAQASANIASGAAGGVSSVPSGAAGAGVGAGAGAGQVAPGGAGASGAAGGRAAKPIDPRLQEIYNGERKMGDRNSVLRGIKPTVSDPFFFSFFLCIQANEIQQDFSHVRKTAESFLGRNNRSRPVPGGVSSANKPGSKTPLGPSAGLPLPKKHESSRHTNPIILLSPSASSLIRMTNAKSFLQDGVFVPPDHPTLSMSTSPNLLEIQRPLHPATRSSANQSSSSSSSSSSKKNLTKFTLVDSTANFRPDHWTRLVAVFTTGQTWQFKSYKWSSPPELFKHATGIYVGWRGEDAPREVKGWGRGVERFGVDRWDEKTAAAAAVAGAGAGAAGAGRWRDREVVEGIWTAIEEGMRLRGWGGR